MLVLSLDLWVGHELSSRGLSLCRLFPKILDEQERLTYKREFDRDHLEYKNLLAEQEEINQDLADLERDLDRLPEGSPQFLVRVRVCPL